MAFIVPNQGTLNRLLATLTVPSNPNLNAEPWNLGEEGIKYTPNDESTVFLPTMTGQVTSPNPFMSVTITIPLLKTQAIANAYFLQMSTNCQIGDIIGRVDSANIDPLKFTNCAIEKFEEIDASGKSAVVKFTIRGTMIVNSSLYQI